jgi:hypothetical protein
MLDLVCTNLRMEALMVEMEEKPYDLCLTILHSFPLSA